jgi:hypothetical protein
LGKDSEPAENHPGLTRKSPFVLTVKLCPKCLNPLQKGSRLGGWLVPQDYYCPNCGYHGVVFLERDVHVGGLGKPKVDSYT